MQQTEELKLKFNFLEKNKSKFEQENQFKINGNY